MSLMATLFPEKWAGLLRIYRLWLEDHLKRPIPADWVGRLMDADARLAASAFRNPVYRCVEIGCGAAIPAIVAARLGAKEVIAFDVSAEMVRLARRMAIYAGAEVHPLCRDFDDFQLPGGTEWMWIAVKPRDNAARGNLLERILEKGIRMKTSLALVPAFGPGTGIVNYRSGCDQAVNRLRTCGYTVHVERLAADFPLRGIVAQPLAAGGGESRQSRPGETPGGLMRTPRSLSARCPKTAAARPRP